MYQYDVTLSSELEIKYYIADVFMDRVLQSIAILFYNPLTPIRYANLIYSSLTDFTVIF